MNDTIIEPTHKPLPSQIIGGVSAGKLRDIGILFIEFSATGFSFYLDGKQIDSNALLHAAIGRTIYSSAESTGLFDSIFRNLPPHNIKELAERSTTKHEGITITRRLLRPDGYVTLRKGNKWGTIINAPEIAGADAPPLESRLSDVFKIFDSYGIQYGDLRSPGHVASLILENEVGRPYLPSEKHQTRFWNSFRGARFEGVTFGKIEGLDYDISSAYPWAISGLADIASCRFIHSNRIRWASDACYAAVWADVVMADNRIRSPLAYRVGEHELYFPVGRFTTWLNLPEIKLLQEYPELGHIEKIHHGSWAVPDYQIPVFSDAMNMLYEIRKMNPQFSDFIKSIMVSCYGKLVSVNDGNASAHWNPVYASHITSLIRTETFRKGMEGNVYGEQADGLIMDKPLIESPGLGGWGLKGQGVMYQLLDMWAGAPWKNLRLDLLSYAHMSDQNEGELNFPLEYHITLPAANLLGLPQRNIGLPTEEWIPLELGSSTRIPKDLVTIGGLLNDQIETRAPTLDEVGLLTLERNAIPELTLEIMGAE